MTSATKPIYRQRLRCLWLPLAAALMWLGPNGAAAVEVKLGVSNDPAVQVVEISGTIERGDGQRVQSFLASLPAGRQVVVSMHSPGGLIDEALRMGRHFHSNHIRTSVIGAGRLCLSACALAFLGGRDQGGQTYRVKGAEALLGFHGFRRVVPDKEYTVSDMHEAVATTQQVLLQIADYLTAVDADIEFMSIMLEKPNSEMNYLSNDRALGVGVHVLQERTGQLMVPRPAVKR